MKKVILLLVTVFVLAIPAATQANSAPVRAHACPPIC